MTKAALETVLGLLPQLSSSEAAKIKAVLDSLTPSEAQPSSATEELLFRALLTVLGKRVSFAQFKATAQYKTWARELPETTRFFERATKGQPRVLKLAFANTLWGVAGDNLRALGVPVGLGSMALNLGRLPELFETEFPGYLQSGLTNLIFDALKRRDK